MNAHSANHTLGLLRDCELEPVPALDHDPVPDLAQDLGVLFSVPSEPGALARPLLHQADHGAGWKRPKRVAVALHWPDGVLGDGGVGPDDVPLLHLVRGDLPPQLVTPAGHGDHGLPHGVVADLDHALLQHTPVTRPALGNSVNIAS